MTHDLRFPVFIRSPSPTSSTPELNWVSLASRASRLPSPSCLIMGRSFFKRREPIALPLLPPPKQDRFSSEPWELNPVSPCSEHGRLPSSSTLIMPVCASKAIHYKTSVLEGRLLPLPASRGTIRNRTESSTLARRDRYLSYLAPWRRDTRSGLVTVEAFGNPGHLPLDSLVTLFLITHHCLVINLQSRAHPSWR
jgi:hypothetical protein